MEYGLIVLVGLLGGIAVGIQSPLSGVMGSRLGGVASSFIVHLGGMILSGIILFMRGGEKIRDWHTLPWYMLGAGVFGLILIQTMSITLPRLGSTMMITLIITGQLITGVVIDHYGLFGIAARHVDLPRGLGVAALLIGGYLISR